jgi:hypothetical protein
MGYNIFSFGINTDKIKAVFGSNDKEVLKKIKDTDAFGDAEAFVASFESETGKKVKTSVKKALEEIIHNKPYDKKSYFSYGYALHCICYALGEKLPGAKIIHFGLETKMIDTIIKDDFGIENVVVNHSFLFADEDYNPFNIPPVEDWPGINLLTKERLNELDEIFKNVKITDDDIKNLLSKNKQEKASAYKDLKGIIENIKYCIKNNLEMINICP